jgi:hypothetical protein
MFIAWCRKEAPIALVADQGLVALRELALETGDGRGAGFGVLLGLWTWESMMGIWEAPLEASLVSRRARVQKGKAPGVTDAGYHK